MIQTDFISDIIIRIKNAAASGKESVVFPHSKFAAAIAAILERTGYLEVLSKKNKKVHRQIEAKLVYTGGVPKFNDASRISKPSRRIYFKTKSIMSVRSGFGHFIISTPKGLLTDKEARKENVGGEALFQIW